jgi:hypothetical protein
MEQAVMVFATATARTTALPTPSEGMFTFLKDSNKLEYYDGSAWQPMVDQDVIAAKGDLIVGTGDDTVAALSVGTNGYVLTADSAEATGLKWAAAAGAGKVLQVVSATTTTTNTNTSGVYADTNLSASITPSANTSKVLILVSQLVQFERTGDVNTGYALRLLRGATAIYSPSNASPFTEYIRSPSTGTHVAYALTPMVYLDSPNTTSATTYKTQHQDTNGDSIAQPGSGPSSIVLLEIGA